MNKTLQKLINLIDQLLIWEQRCILCADKSRQQVCSQCLTSLQPQRQLPRCPRCLIYLPPKEIRCKNCQDNHFYFERIIAACEYTFPLTHVLHQLKYYNRLEYSRGLSQIFYRRLVAQLTHLPDLMIPVPLHITRQRQRGFNQALELVREFHNHYPQIQLAQATRIKATQSQATLNRIQRLHNLENAFAVNINLENKHVALIDDVVTTGTTVNELARLCKQRGARQVDIWCLMRANHD